MATKDNKQEEQSTKQQESEEKVQAEEAQCSENDAEVEGDADAGKDENDPTKQIEKHEKELEDSKKDYLFLMAEFDNFRKRTLKEKSEIIKNGAENAMRDLLPVIDDFERAIKAIGENSEIESLKEGVDLIYNKFMKYLEHNGVKPIDSTGKDFDTELHEAVTMFPAADESQKGKIVDTVQTGYMLNDKVLRHAKVVVGQ